MSIKRLLIAAVFFSNSALACIELPVISLSEDSYEALVDYLDDQHPELDASKSIRDILSYGFDVANSALIEFEPHRVENGADVYHVFSCKLSSSAEWNCEDLEEKREVSFEKPIDRVRLADGVDADVASQILASIRNTIMIDGEGTYWFKQWDKVEESAGPLDIVSIFLDSEEQYVASAYTLTPCSSHRIRVKEIPCGLGSCAFDVVENTVMYYP